VWDGECLKVRQRSLAKEFHNAVLYGDSYVNCSAFELFTGRPPSEMLPKVTANTVKDSLKSPDDSKREFNVSVWHAKLTSLVTHNRFQLPDRFKRRLSLEMEQWYLTGCHDVRSYRYMRVCLLIAFNACITRLENMCIMHLMMSRKNSLSDDDVNEVFECFDFKDITDSVICNGVFPRSLFDVL